MNRDYDAIGRLTVLVLMTALLATANVRAATNTWIGAATGNWDNASLWVGGVPNGIDTVARITNNANGTAVTTANVDVVVGQILGSLNNNAVSPGWNILSDVSSRNITMQVANGKANIQVNGNSGTLRIDPNLVLASPLVVAITGGNGPKITLNGAIAGTGDLVISNATSDANTGAAITLTNNVNMTGAITASGNSTGKGSTMISGNIGANVTTLTKSDKSGTLTLSGSNALTGGVTLNSGTLKIGNAAALGTNAFTIVGATFDNSTAGALTNVGNNTQSWNGDFTFIGSQSLDLGSGAVTLGGNRQINVSAKTLTIGGVIDDGPNTYGLTKVGTGKLLLNGYNAYGGATTISTGRLSIGASGFIGGTPVLNGTGVLGLNAAGNLTPGTKILVGSNNVLVAESDVDVSVFADNASTGVLGIDASAFTRNMDLSAISGLWLGSVAGGTITGGTLTPAGGTYLLGGGGGTLTISTNNYLTGSNNLVVNGNVAINNVQNFTGTTTVNSGNTLTLNADAISAGSGVTVSGTVARSAASTLNNLSGTGNLSTSAGSLTLTLNNTFETLFTGSLDSTGNNSSDVVKNGPAKFGQQGTWNTKNNIMTINAGEHSISGNGAEVITYNARGIVNQGATVTLDNSSVNRTDRVAFNQSQSGTGSGTALTMNGATLNLIGNSSANSSQQLGNLTYKNTTALLIGAGNSTISITAGSGRSAILSFTSNQSGGNACPAFTRSAGATVLIKGTALGTTVATNLTANTANIVFTGNQSTFAPPLTGSVGKGIVNGVFIDTVTGGNDVYGIGTYDNGVDAANATSDDVGFRALKDDTENQGTLGAGVNVKATSALANDGSTINSLHLASGGSITDGGSKTQTVTSGTILSTGAANAIGSASSSDTLAFVSEAMFYTATGSTLTVNTKITGTGGLTKGGDGTLVLANTNNTFSGNTVWINGGILSISTNANLGAVANNVNLNNGGVLQATATFALDNGTTKRGIVVGGTTANTITSGGIDVTGANTLTVNGVISGVGKLVKTGTGALVLNGNNTYSGGTLVSNGTLGGTGTVAGVISVTGGSLSAGGINTAGTLTVSNLTLGAGGTLNVNLQSGSSAGKIVVNGPVTLAGALQVTFINGYTPAPSGSWTILTATSVSGTFVPVPSGYTVQIVGGNTVVLYRSPPKGTSVFFR